MALQRSKIALNAARFPLVSTKGSRAVFVPGLDSAPRTPRTYMGDEASADYNMPQVLYMENVMPLAEGLRSVGLSTDIAAHSVSTWFDQAIMLRDSIEQASLFVPADGYNYIYNYTTNAWVSHPVNGVWGEDPSVSSTNTYATATVTSASVEGYTFVCYSRMLGGTTNTDNSIIVWNETTSTFAKGSTILDNVPFAAGEIDGVAASNGNLIIWSGLEVAWAPFNGTKFDFSAYANNDYTGAGVQTPQDVRGVITAIGNLPGGFVMFTTKNAVAAAYHANNISSPWAFREVSGGGGVEGPEQVVAESGMGALYAYTTAGLQKLSLNSAELIHPAISDFIAGRQIERAAGVGGSFSLTSTEYAEDLRVKLATIGERYLVVSYGPPGQNFEYALVVDFALQRWGKIRVNHVDAFAYSRGILTTGITYADAATLTYASQAAVTYDSTSQTTDATATAPHMLAFLTNTGAVTVANWAYDTRAATDTGIALIGRVQLSRSRNTQLNRIEIEGPEAATVTVYPSYNGYALAAGVAPVVVDSSPGYLCVGTGIDCKNFNIGVFGTFALTTMIFEALPSGQI